MTFTQIIENRYSCRKFTDKKISRDMLQAIVEAGNLAPSGHNKQPWEFTVVDTPESLAKLVPMLQSPDSKINSFVSDVPAMIIITERNAVEKEKDLDDTVIGKQDYQSMDIGIATAYLDLKAQELGISTVILGWLHPYEIRDAFGIDKQNKVRLVLALGYPDEGAFRARRRRPIEEVVRFV